MVNLVAAQRPLMNKLMKIAGVVPHIIEIEQGTVMNFWVPRESIKIPKKIDEEKNDKKQSKKPKPNKPVVILIHGFATEGIVTWQFQIGSLTKKYKVYVPDLLFFGGSTTNNPDRSPRFQAECLHRGLEKLGVEKCTVVGFSYGGMVAFKLAQMYPEMVQNMVISGSILAMTDSISKETLQELGFSSSSELLLPTSVKGLKALMSVAVHMKLWFPNKLYKDFLEVMFNNRKEREELLEGLINSSALGENDQIFKLELAKEMKEQLGDKVTFQGIKKAGHLVHLERPCVYNSYLNQVLASFNQDEVLQ